VIFVLKAETCPDDGMMNWAYMLIYAHHDPGMPLVKLDEYSTMKEGSIQVPAFYLGLKLKKNVLPNGVIASGMISSNYVQYTVQNVHEYMIPLSGGKKLPKKDHFLFAGGYKHELHESP
jgi:hypothetical protein